MPVSLVLTVKNEAATIGPMLESVARQTRAPDEIVIVDGGSSDGTVDALLAQGDCVGAAPLRLEIAPGCTIAQGRNLAVMLAREDVLAVTDGGCVLDRLWLERLTEPFESNSQRPDVVSGFFVAAPVGVFELALAATTLPDADELDVDTFLPSSRSVAFTRDAWLRAGGYPEWLDYCEDLVFDLALQRAGCRFAFAPDAICYYRPRPSVGAFFRQYYQYARGDGKADLWRRRHAIRYAAFAAATALLVSGWRAPWLLIPLLLGGAGYLRRPYRRLARPLRGRGAGAALQAAAWVPVLRLVGDVAKMAGYPVGWSWRLRTRRNE